MDKETKLEELLMRQSYLLGQASTLIRFSDIDELKKHWFFSEVQNIMYDSLD